MLLSFALALSGDDLRNTACHLITCATIEKNLLNSWHWPEVRKIVRTVNGILFLNSGFSTARWVFNFCVRNTPLRGGGGGGGKKQTEYSEKWSLKKKKNKKKINFNTPSLWATKIAQSGIMRHIFLQEWMLLRPVASSCTRTTRITNHAYVSVYISLYVSREQKLSMLSFRHPRPFPSECQNSLESLSSCFVTLSWPASVDTLRRGKMTDHFKAVVTVS